MSSPRRDVVLVVLVLVISGNPAIYPLGGGEDLVLVIAAALLAIALAVRHASVWHPRLWWVLGGMLAISAVQAVEFDFLPVVTIAGLGIRLFIAAAVISLVSDFPTAYVKAMVAISVYVLVIYTIDQSALALDLDFRSLFSPLERLVGIDGDHRFTLVYTFTVTEGTYRDSGFFREPGLYAGYLLLALLLLMLRGATLDRKAVVRYGAILVIALATTFSTAGYITAPLVLAAAAFQYSDRLRRTVSRSGVFSTVLVISVVTVWGVSQNTDFIEQKIVGQYEELMAEGRGYEITRFGAALLDAQAIEERPWFGWGVHESTKYAQTPELAELAPSGGVTGWIRSFGLVGFAILVIAFWRGARGLVGASSSGAIYVTLVILLIAQPNTFLNYPLFMALMFLPDKARDEVVAETERIAHAREDVIEAESVERAE